MQASTQTVIEFLTEMVEAGLGYSSVNSAKAAVCAFLSTCSDPTNHSTSPLLARFMKGVFNYKPVIPKASFTWDVSVLLKHLAKLSPPKALNLITLSAKLATLLLLLSGQRGQSIYLLNLEDVEVNPNNLILRFSELLKQSKPGRHLDEVMIPAYPEERLCVVATFKEYIKRTAGLRKSKTGKLFIVTKKPHQSASRDTLSRWIKWQMRLAGIDMSRFASHSVRSASTSAACAGKVPLPIILRTAGWSKEDTFRKFYKKPIGRQEEFAQSILSLHKK